MKIETKARALAATVITLLMVCVIALLHVFADWVVSLELTQAQCRWAVAIIGIIGFWLFLYSELGDE